MGSEADTKVTVSLSPLLFSQENEKANHVPLCAAPLEVCRVV